MYEHQLTTTVKRVQVLSAMWRVIRRVRAARYSNRVRTENCSWVVQTTSRAAVPDWPELRLGLLSAAMGKFMRPDLRPALKFQQEVCFSTFNLNYN